MVASRPCATGTELALPEPSFARNELAGYDAGIFIIWCPNSRHALPIVNEATAVIGNSIILKVEIMVIESKLPAILGKIVQILRHDMQKEAVLEVEREDFSYL